jgi:hypothetical protein
MLASVSDGWMMADMAPPPVAVKKPAHFFNLSRPLAPALFSGREERVSLARADRVPIEFDHRTNKAPEQTVSQLQGGSSGMKGTIPPLFFAIAQIA